MNLSEFYNEVSRHVDTDKTKIDVAATKRVLAEAFKVLEAMDTADAADLIAKGLKAAAKKKK